MLNQRRVKKVGSPVAGGGNQRNDGLSPEKMKSHMSSHQPAIIAFMGGAIQSVQESRGNPVTSGELSHSNDFATRVRSWSFEEWKSFIREQVRKLLAPDGQSITVLWSRPYGPYYALRLKTRLSWSSMVGRDARTQDRLAAAPDQDRVAPNRSRGTQRRAPCAVRRALPASS
jgi:hypothetical protein